MPGRWLFLAGMVLGIALGVAAGIWRGKLNEDSPVGEDGRWKAAARETGTLSTVTKVAGRGTLNGGREGVPRRRIGRNGGVEGLTAMVLELSKLKTIKEVNFVDLIRQVNTLTQMSEGEVVSLIAVLGSEEFKEQLAGEEAFQEIMTVLAVGRMAELNGPEAMRILVAADEDSELGGDRRSFAAMCMTSWVASDPEGALAWLEGVGLGSEEGFQDLVSEPDFSGVVAAALMKVDPEMARKFADESRGAGRTDALEALARHEESSEGVRGLLETTGASEVEARGAVLRVWSVKDPQGAASWLDAQPKGEGHSKLVRQVAGNFLDKDPAGGAAWYMSQEIPEGGDAERYRTVVGRWVHQDHEAAGEWLRSQPDGEDRDDAEIQMAMARMHRRDWEAAFEWLGGVIDEGKQEQNIEHLFSNGIRRDGETSEAFAKAVGEAGYGEAFESYREGRSGRE